MDVGPWTVASTWTWTPSTPGQRLSGESRRSQCGQQQHQRRNGPVGALHSDGATNVFGGAEGKCGLARDSGQPDSLFGRAAGGAAECQNRWVGVQRKRLERGNGVDNELDVVLDAYGGQWRLHGWGLGAGGWELHRRPGGVRFRPVADQIGANAAMEMEVVLGFETDFQWIVSCAGIRNGSTYSL